MLIYVVHNPESVFNRSIWQGYLNAFQALGHDAFAVPQNDLPHPKDIAQVPDLLFVVHGDQHLLQRVKLYKLHGVTTAIVLLDEPYEVDRTVSWSREFDWTLTCDRMTVERHKQNSRCLFVPLAYDETVFSTKGPKIESEVLLLGSCYDARKEVLGPLLDEMGDWLTFVGRGWKKFLAGGATHHDDYVQDPRVVAAWYRGAKIILNIHRNSTWSHFGRYNEDQLLATHLNPRVWEAAACGTLQVCSPREDLAAYFPDMPTFASPEHLVTVVRHLLDRKHRKALAEKIRKQAVPHTYRARAEMFLESLVTV